VGLSVRAGGGRGSAEGIAEALWGQGGGGIGAGILGGGEVYRGASGAAGKIGYLPYPDDRVPADGLGPFEHAAGGHAYARLGRAAAERANGLLLRGLAGGNADAADAKVVV